MNSKTLGIIILLFSLFCLGTWPAILRSCSSRHPCHVYIDYALAYVVVSTLILAFIHLGNNGDKENNSDIHINNFCWQLVLISMLGGALLSLGNMSFQWSTSVYGASLTTVVAIQASLCVCLGTGLNYLLQPDRTSHPGLLLDGTGCFFIAICLAAAAHVRYYKEQQQKEFKFENDGGTKNESGNDIISRGILSIEELTKTNRGEKLSYDPLVEEVEGGNILMVSKKEYHPALVGLVIGCAGGLCFGFFSPAFNIAVNDPFHWGDGKNKGLSVLFANLCFSVAFTVISVLGNLLLMAFPPRHPYEIELCLRSSVTDYLREEPKLKLRAFSAGFVCAVGNLLQFQGGKLAGFAAADLVQAFPLVATIYDILIFREFWRASSSVITLLVVMYVFYISGIVFVADSIA